MKLTDIGTPKEFSKYGRQSIIIKEDEINHFKILMLYLESKGWVWGNCRPPTEFVPDWVGDTDGHIVLDGNYIYQSPILDDRDYLSIDWDEEKTQTPIKVISGTYCSCQSSKVEKRHSGFEWFDFCVNCRKEVNK